jgi:hypothetical protein
MNRLSTLSDEKLREEEAWIGGCLYRAEDVFAQMLLTGRLKAIHREIQRRTPSHTVAEKG